MYVPQYTVEYRPDRAFFEPSVPRRAYPQRLVLLTVSRAQNEANRQEEPRVLVRSEDEPERMLLETRICKEDGFQKQQGMLV